MFLARFHHISVYLILQEHELCEEIFIKVAKFAPRDSQYSAESDNQDLQEDIMGPSLKNVLRQMSSRRTQADTPAGFVSGFDDGVAIKAVSVKQTIMRGPRIKASLDFGIFVDELRSTSGSIEYRGKVRSSTDFSQLSYLSSLGLIDVSFCR